ncbi:MAG: nicotinate phosphoribosyltransferase [Alphaproteobacteria bacterium]|nr:nicotinate phosphoribosyltransferase [Alphaproteobacteria bacterium]
MPSGFPGPSPEKQPALTDSYFLRTKAVVARNGDAEVTYAVFMRRPVLSAPRLAVEWLEAMLASRNTSYTLDLRHPEGSWVGAGEPILYITGPLSALVDLETIFLQRIGSASVAAYNANAMCSALPGVSFLAMDARHCAGTDMAELMAYGASVGSNVAKAQNDAVGFVGCATDHTAHYFGTDKGRGTMPHALIGYAGSTVKAAQIYDETFPDEPLTVLVDYFGREVTDGLAVARAFPERAKAGTLALRIDTHGGRYMEGLDVQQSYAVLERNAADAIRGYRVDNELKHLIGTGVSAAAAWLLREKLDEEGFSNVKIVCSSGFGPEKCRVFALARTPVDIIGTGSYLPNKWSETYATADIISYDGQSRVKTGREFLIPS